jgi:hypothetical protein
VKEFLPRRNVHGIINAWIQIFVPSTEYSQRLNPKMSFGFSLGDFIAVIGLANKIRKVFVDAPTQFKDISKELVTLSDKSTSYLFVCQD